MTVRTVVGRSHWVTLVSSEVQVVQLDSRGVLRPVIHISIDADVRWKRLGLLALLVVLTMLAPPVGILVGAIAATLDIRIQRIRAAEESDERERQEGDRRTAMFSYN